jgi:hypothetical protein
MGRLADEARHGAIGLSDIAIQLVQLSQLESPLVTCAIWYTVQCARLTTHQITGSSTLLTNYQSLPTPLLPAPPLSTIPQINYATHDYSKTR